MITMIVAMDDAGVIGNKGKIPWHIPADLKRLARLTRGGTVVLGRKTYESMAAAYNGKKMPAHTYIVLTHTPRENVDPVYYAQSLGEARRMVSPYADLFVLGGAQVYEQFLPLADRLIVTVVPGEHKGDTSFPPFPHEGWAVVDTQAHKDHGLVVYDRKMGW